MIPQQVTSMHPSDLFSFSLSMWELGKIVCGARHLTSPYLPSLILYWFYSLRVSVLEGVVECTPKYNKIEYFRTEYVVIHFASWAVPKLKVTWLGVPFFNFFFSTKGLKQYPTRCGFWFSCCCLKWIANGCYTSYLGFTNIEIKH